MRSVNPDQVELIRAWIEEHLSAVFTAFPGSVNAWDPTTQLADITPMIKYPVRQPDESTVYEDLPVVPSCPIILPRTAKWALTMPIDVGDLVLVVVTELSFRQWLAGAGTSTEYPGDLRRHHLANAVAIPGWFTQQSPVPNWPPKPSGAQATDPQLQLGCFDTNQTSGGTMIQMTADGTLTVMQGTNTRFVVDPTGIVSAGDTVANTQGNWVYGGSGNGRDWCSSVEGAINKLITAVGDLVSDVNNLTVVGEAALVGVPLPHATSDPLPSDIADPPTASATFKNKA